VVSGSEWPVASGQWSVRALHDDRVKKCGATSNSQLRLRFTAIAEQRSN
jgi:hypothetical protein